MITSRVHKAAVSLVAGVGLLGGTLAAAAPADATTPIHTTAVSHRATVDDVKIGVERVATHSAGHSYVDLTFRNVSDHAVTIHGYTGLSLVAYGNGTQVGRPAGWLTNRAAVTTRLEPGHRTTEIVSIADAADFGPLRQHTVQADGFRVYLPGERRAAFVPFSVSASTRNVTQLQVSPIGARI